MNEIDLKKIQDEQKIENNIPISIDYPGTNFWEELERVANLYPNNLAMNYYGKKLTYKELMDEVYKMAIILNKRGINKGDTVNISSPNIPDAIIAFYAMKLSFLLISIRLLPFLLQTNPPGTLHRNVHLQILSELILVVEHTALFGPVISSTQLHIRFLIIQNPIFCVHR